MQDPHLEGMGTTLTALLFAGGRVGLVHVGDSRAYLVRGGQLTQITHDDTFVQALIDEGRMTAEEASSHPQRSLILRALNGADVEPDLSIREVRIGDRYLLCSDGLSDVVSPDTLLEALQQPDPHESADRLVELALRGGGPDNVTCIVADVIDVPYADDAPVMDGAVGGNRAAAGAGADQPGVPGRDPQRPPGADRHRAVRAGASAPAAAADRLSRRCSCSPCSAPGRTGCGGGRRRSTSSAPRASRWPSSAGSTPRSARCTSTPWWTPARCGWTTSCRSPGGRSRAASRPTTGPRRTGSWSPQRPAEAAVPAHAHAHSDAVDDGQAAGRPADAPPRPACPPPSRRVPTAPPRTAPSTEGCRLPLTAPPAAAAGAPPGAAKPVPTPPGHRAGAARLRGPAGRRRGRRRGRDLQRHDQLGRADLRRRLRADLRGGAPRGPLARAVRGPGDPADGRPAQRARPGADPAAGPGRGGRRPAGRQPGAGRRRERAGGVDLRRAGAVRRRAAGGPGPPRAGPLRVHAGRRRPGLPRPAGAAARLGSARSTAPRSGSGWPASPSSRASSRRSR